MSDSESAENDADLDTSNSEFITTWEEHIPSDAASPQPSSPPDRYPFQQCELNIGDPEPGEVPEEQLPVSYEMLLGATSRGEDVLSSSDGYTYTRKKANLNGSVRWICTYRNSHSHFRCRASVTVSSNNVTIPGKFNHVHPAEKSDTFKRLLVTDA